MSSVAELVRPVEEAPADLVEVTGVIKWFDAAKGYGFIVPNDGGPDVLLHAKCLHRSGFEAAYEGTRVVCEVLQREKGLQAYHVLNVDDTGAISPARRIREARTDIIVAPTSGLERAIVKWFDRVRGYGFLTRGEGTEDIFIHMETLRYFRLAALEPGQVVLVRYGKGPKGLVATEIHPDR